MLLPLASCQSPFVQEDKAYQELRGAIVQDFQRQIDDLGLATPAAAATQPAAALISSEFTPWWSQQVRQPIFVTGESRDKHLAQLLDEALHGAPQIKVFSDIPLIRRTAIAEAQGRFTPRAFAEGKYGYREQPVGSTLETGGPPQLEEVTVSGEAGVKTMLPTGGEVRLSQRLDYLNNNSVFLVPDAQTTARTTLSLIQPLLAGGGIEYNRSLVRIAYLDSKVAMAEFLRQAEQHLLEVTRTYWALYLSRAQLLQQRRFVAATAALVGQLENRRDLDAAKGQLAQARAALAERSTDLVRAEAAVHNAQDRLRALVGSSNQASAGAEMVPADEPAVQPTQASLQTAARAALYNRSEIQQSFLQYRAAKVRLGMAQNEAQPQLDLILEGSLNGLDANKDVSGAIDDEGEHSPSGLVGLHFEAPLGDAEPQARELRRRLEMRQQLNQMRTTIDTVLLEVKVSVREVQTAFQEMTARFEAMRAVKEDADILQQRWEQGVGLAEGLGTSYLDLLLDAQQRLVDAEDKFERSRTNYNVAMMNLERAKGTLLRSEGIVTSEGIHEKLPTLELRQGKSTETAPAEPEAQP